ncbi:MAG TPA: type II secretion system protein [Candidatus Hydrogenedentes bacterium]|nr:type II secretion system protein [Candidatus Hydrogenedentota bacterium]
MMIRQARIEEAGRRAGGRPPRAGLRASSAGGYTLPEILVAMVILLVIMSGVVALFSGAVSTVFGSYQTMDAFAMARSLTSAMERDLAAAFTAREQGAYYQFYGRPEGFVFVGTLESGGIGRVTYVLRPMVFGADQDGNVVERLSGERRITEIAEPWTYTLGRIAVQARQYGVSRGMSGEEINALEAAAKDLVKAKYHSVDPGDESSMALVEFRVMAQNYALVRYEEPGVTDLDNFPLPGDLVWPYVAPELSNTGLVHESDEYDSSNTGLYHEILSAINPQVSDDTYDMRTLLWQQNQNVSLNMINADVVQKILDAKRREIWIRMLAGDPDLDTQDTQTYCDKNYPKGECPLSSLGEWFWNDKNINDYLPADRILYKAQLLDPETDVPLMLPVSDEKTPMDALYGPGIFSYCSGDFYFDEKTHEEKEVSSHFFNDNMNLQPFPKNSELNGELDYPGYMRTLMPDIEDLQAFDDFLTRIKASKVDSLPGSPLEPRLPYKVAPQFWLLLEAREPGAPDYRRWFSQIITLPSGFTRGLGGVTQ